MNRFFFFCFFIALSYQSIAQKQLLLMKGEKVLLRLYPGDEIIFKLKGSDRKWTTYVNNLSDTSVVVHQDTIPFRKIERLYFDQTAFHNRLGMNLMVAGVTLFLIDQLNYSVIQGNDPSLDGWVSRVSLGAIGIGLPLWLSRKKSQKVNHKYRLFMARESSVFYRPDTRGNIGY
jgi:hypothetical protein